MVAAQQWLVTMWDTALAGYAEAVEAAARSTHTDSTKQGGTT
jgi:hypothetical protein